MSAVGERVSRRLAEACQEQGTTLAAVLDGLGADWRMRRRIQGEQPNPNLVDIEQIGRALGRRTWAELGEFMIELFRERSRATEARS